MEALGRASMAACQPQGQAGCWLSGSTSPGTVCLRGGGCCTVRHCGRGCPPWSLAVTDLSSTRGTILVGQVCCPGRRRSLCINSLHKHVLSTYCVPASQRGFVGTVISFNPYNKPMWWGFLWFSCRRGGQGPEQWHQSYCHSEEAESQDPTRFDLRGHASQNNTWGTMVAKGGT